MWYKNKYEVNKPPEQSTQQIIDSLTKDIDRMTAEKAEIWNEIKDMRVSANKADEKYQRMVRLTRAIKKLTNERKKLS